MPPIAVEGELMMCARMLPNVSGCRDRLRRARPVPAKALLALLFLASAVPGPAQAAWHERSEAIMGTRITVELWHEDPAKADQAIEAVMAEMRRIDALMSHYKPDSQISAINARAAQEP